VREILIPRRFTFGRLKFGPPFLDTCRRMWLVRFVAEISRRTSLPVVLIYSSPIFGQVAARAKGDFVAFDFIDDPDLLRDQIAWLEYNKREKALMAVCNCVFVTAATLGDYIRERYPNARVESIPNGVDFDWFSGAASKAEIPEELKSVPRPIAGFTGALYNWRNAPLLLRVAKARPGVSFVFVGYREKGGIFDELLKLPNVRYFKEKPYEEMPAWVNAFDVCLIPLAAGSMAKFMNPKKLYEYLALGKPTIVSNNLYDIKNFETLIYSAEGEDGFIRSLDAALNESDASLARRRVAFAGENSWGARAEAIENIVRRTLDERSRGT